MLFNTVPSQSRYNLHLDPNFQLLRRRDAHNCYYWDDIVVVGLAILGSLGILLLVHHRVRENDEFQIREEIVRTIGGCAICVGESPKRNLRLGVEKTRLVVSRKIRNFTLSIASQQWALVKSLYSRDSSALETNKKMGLGPS